jgi:capsular polysaccharide export protein
MTARSFLFLQGVCSPFFPCLADRLAADGHRVLKVNYNCGDLLYWGRRPACSFKDTPDRQPRFLENTFNSNGISDIVLFGDRRPVHIPAVALAIRTGVRVHVFEEGYFRPHWVTLERDGVNNHSLLPRDPAWYRAVGARLSDYGDGEAFPSPFRLRAGHDVFYHLAGALNPLLFPRYRTHATVPAPVEYAGYCRRFALMPRYERRDAETIGSLLTSRVPFYLLPLQLNSDTQIRDHSPFADMSGVMEFVMASFAAHAPTDARLVIKNHPLDMGLVDYPAVIKALEKRFGLTGRISYLESGDLEALLRKASGVVTVNSTVGGLALGLACPTMALSDPIYNLAGLTFKGPLDEFWKERIPPDAEQYRCFRNTVIHTTQINGGFYSRQGIDLAVRNAVPALTAGRSPLEELL